MISLDELTQFLNQYFAVDSFGDDQGGVYRPSTRPIKRLGLALEPWSNIGKWAHDQRLDALFLHRPWKLELERLSPDVGVVAYHLAFDERLTLGFNLRLADVLGMSALSVLGEKEGRPIGMIGQIPATDNAQFYSCLNQLFGGCDEVRDRVQSEISRVAVVGAMTDALVREAVARHADIYITGQFRQPAAVAVLETGIGVVAVGHRRCEEWGLRSLAGVVRDRWFKIKVILPPFG